MATLLTTRKLSPPRRAWEAFRAEDDCRPIILRSIAGPNLYPMAGWAIMNTESHLAQAERHVREGEARVARLIAIIEELERDGHPKAAARAREVLATIQQSLALAVEPVMRPCLQKPPEIAQPVLTH